MCCLGVVRYFVLVLGMHFRMLKFYLTNMPIISTGIQIKMLRIQFRFVLIAVTVPYLNRVVHSICESFTMCRLSPFVYWQGPLNLYISIVKVLDFTQTDLAFDLSLFFHLLGFVKCAVDSSFYPFGRLQCYLSNKLFGHQLIENSMLAQSCSNEHTNRINTRRFPFKSDVFGFWVNLFSRWLTAGNNLAFFLV